MFTEKHSLYRYIMVVYVTHCYVDTNNSLHDIFVTNLFCYPLIAVSSYYSSSLNSYEFITLIVISFFVELSIASCPCIRPPVTLGTAHIQ